MGNVLMASKIIEIFPISGFGRALAYKVPEGMELRVGKLVRIPLQRRIVLGVVSKMSSNEDVPEGKLKSVIEVVYDEPVMSEVLLRLAMWMSIYYGASLEGVFEAMVPAVLRKGRREKVEKVYCIGEELDDAEKEVLKKRAKRQEEIYEYVRELGGVTRGDLMKKYPNASASIKSLEEKGLLKFEERLVKGVRQIETKEISGGELELSAEQGLAFEDIGGSLDEWGFQVHLLQGVTGSGKTEVYLRLMEKVVKEGGGAIFLVPEVSLTPQTVERVKRKLEPYGEQVVVWHSQLSEGERLSGWLALMRGEAKVVVGARSAVFAPVKDLRLVIVDEEHEGSYKQGDSPRYHGRDVAVYRSFLEKAVCVLGSATPSLETLRNLETKGYKLNSLSKRVDDRSLPKVTVVDMKPEIMKGGGNIILSQALLDKVKERFYKKEQVILFINRRGYSSAMVCPKCQYVAECDHCSVKMTYHKSKGLLRCHMCDAKKPAPESCPECGSSKIRWGGTGTQKVEDVVGKLVPGARVVRVDTDSVGKKDRLKEVLGDFKDGEIDILIGTQMIAKGLDFPNVTLVGVINADISMHMEDFRANERTFQLIVQVAGRAGRGKEPGEVVIQTYNPASAPIRFAKDGNTEGFYDQEFEQRREFMYPPYRSLVRLLFRGKDAARVEKYAEKCAEIVNREVGGEVEFRGPGPAPIERIKDDYRYHAWIFTRSVSKLMPKLLQARSKFPKQKDVIEVIDVDPVDLG